MLKIFLILTLLISFSLSFEGLTKREVKFDNKLSIEEGRKVHDDYLKREGRLGGGSVAGDTDFPFAADILSVWANGDIGGCSGAIIASFIVLTSRDCMFSDILLTTPTDVLVQVGSATRNVPRMLTFVISATWLDRWQTPAGPHPNFAIAYLRDNLAMSSTVNVIRLPSHPQSTMTFDLVSVDVAGWGPSTGSFLHWGRGIVTTPGELSGITGITEYELALRPSALIFEVGDNGGPVVLREGSANTLIGTLWTSRHSPSHNTNLITFMRIGHFWDFIHDETGIPRRWN